MTAVFKVCGEGTLPRERHFAPTDPWTVPSRLGHESFPEPRLPPFSSLEKRGAAVATSAFQLKISAVPWVTFGAWRSPRALGTRAEVVATGRRAAPGREDGSRDADLRARMVSGAGKGQPYRKRAGGRGGRPLSWNGHFSLLWAVPRASSLRDPVGVGPQGQSFILPSFWTIKGKVPRGARKLRR